MSDALSLPQAGLVGMDGRPIIAAASNDPYWLDDEQETKDHVFSTLGDLSDVDVFYNWVLIVKHVRRVVARGLLAAPETQNEDRWQGKVGLIVKKGPAAFQDDDRNKFYGANPEIGEWVVFRNSDGWDADLGKRTERLDYFQCRYIQDAHIIGRTKFPGRIY